MCLQSAAIPRARRGDFLETDQRARPARSAECAASMGDRLAVFKAAAVQASAVFLDREASVAKACALIGEAGRNGAKLVVLPEVFVPGGPYWAWHMPMREGLEFSARLYRHSVDVPGPATARLGAGGPGGRTWGEPARALPGYTLAAMGEQVHVAAFLGFATADISLTETLARYHAIAYNSFVVCSQSVVDRGINERLGPDRQKPRH